MNRLAKFAAPILMWMVPGFVFALGLGEIHVKSSLNEALEAEIELLYSDASEAQATEVKLASAEDFRRVGLDRNAISVPLSFAVFQDTAGRYLIRVTSERPVGDPFVDFLIEVNWTNGRLLREYVILLDPPVTTPAEAVAVSEPPRPQPPQAAPRPETVRQPGAVASAGGGSYQVRRGDTLWEIARDRRPSGEITINQMMMLLYQSNPDAFFADNINALKAGAVLRLPELEDLRALPALTALSRVRTQNQAWESYRQSAARTTPTVSEAAQSPEFVRNERAPAVEDESRLQLVPAAGAGGSDQGRPGASSAELSAVRSDLARSREELVSAGQENAELRSRVGELESLVSNLERAITLKDADLADLQNQVELAQMEPASGGAIGIERTSADLEAELSAAAAADGDAAPITRGFEESAAVDVDGGQAKAPGADAAIAERPPSPPGLVDKLMAAVKNPMLLGGIGIVLALGVGGLFWSRRRGQASAGESLVDRMMAADSVAEDPDGDLVAGAADADAAELSAAVEADPQNAQAHLALLRRYYATDRSDEFARAAERMFAEIGGETHPAWMEARAMGANLVPNHPLFDAAGAGFDTAGAGFDAAGAGQSAAEQDLDFGIDSVGDAGESLADDALDLDALDLNDELNLEGPPPEDDDLSLDFELEDEDFPGSADAPDEVGAAAAEPADDEMSLDFDLEPADLPGGPDEADPGADLGSATGEQGLELTSEDDLTLEFDLDEVAENGPPAEDWADDEDFPDLDLEGLDVGEDAGEPEDPASAAEVDTEFNLQAVTPAADEADTELDLDLDLGVLEESATEEAAVDPDQASNESATLAELESSDEDLGLDDLNLDDKALFGDDDAVGTKLDLAKAYIDMGDPEGARGMLEEVLAEGNPGQKDEAEDLLGRLAP